MYTMYICRVSFNLTISVLQNYITMIIQYSNLHNYNFTFIYSIIGGKYIEMHNAHLLCHFFIILTYFTILTYYSIYFFGRERYPI